MNWISIFQEEPPRNTYILVLFGDGTVKTSKWGYGVFADYYNGEIIWEGNLIGASNWMPSPEALPQEDRHKVIDQIREAHASK